MAKPKRQPKRSQSSKVTVGEVGWLSVDQAFQQLLSQLGESQEASGHLDEAFRKGVATLWGRHPNGEWFPVLRDIFAGHLTIKARETPHGWHAEVAMTKSVDRFAETEWAVSASEIGTLDEDKTVPGEKRGPKEKYDWELFLARFVLKLHEEKVPASGAINFEQRAKDSAA